MAISCFRCPTPYDPWLSSLIGIQRSNSTSKENEFRCWTNKWWNSPEHRSRQRQRQRQKQRRGRRARGRKKEKYKKNAREREWKVFGFCSSEATRMPLHFQYLSPIMLFNRSLQQIEQRFAVFQYSFSSGFFFGCGCCYSFQYKFRSVLTFEPWLRAAWFACYSRQNEIKEIRWFKPFFELSWI